jgi:hypothetical protein
LLSLVKLLNEIGATGAVGGFVGKKGQDVDDLFAGPFYPSKEANQVLKNQVKNNGDKVKFSEKITPLQDLEMVLVEMDYVFDEYPNYADKLLFINDTTDMKEVDLNLTYDMPDYGDDKSIFINDSNDYKLVEGK